MKTKNERPLSNPPSTQSPSSSIMETYTFIRNANTDTYSLQKSLPKSSSINNSQNTKPPSNMTPQTLFITPTTTTINTPPYFAISTPTCPLPTATCTHPPSLRPTCPACLTTYSRAREAEIRNFYDPAIKDAEERIEQAVQRLWVSENEFLKVRLGEARREIERLRGERVREVREVWGWMRGEG